MVRVLTQEKHLIELCIKMSPTVKLLKKKNLGFSLMRIAFTCSPSLFPFFFFLRLTIFFFSKKKLFLGLKIQWLIS